MLRTHKDTQKHLEAHNITNAKYPNKITSNHTHTYTPRHECTRRDTLLQTHTDLDTQRPTRTQKDTNSFTGTWHKSTKNTIISIQIPALAYIRTQNTIFIEFTLGQLRLIQLKDTWLYNICLIFLQSNNDLTISPQNDTKNSQKTWQLKSFMVFVFCRESKEFCMRQQIDVCQQFPYKVVTEQLNLKYSMFSLHLFFWMGENFQLKH